MNKLLTLVYILCFLLTVHLVNAAPKADLPHLFKRHHTPVEKVETRAEHLARFQVQLINVLHLQPHQICVLRRNLLNQSEAVEPGAALAPALSEVLKPVLNAEQQTILQALPTDAAFAPEFAALSLRP